MFVLKTYLEDSEDFSCSEVTVADIIHPATLEQIYWTRRLQGYANQAVLTFSLLGQDGLSKPDINSFHKRVISLMGTNSILSINYYENTNFVSLVMDCPEAAASVRQEVAELDGALVCYVESKPLNNYRVRVLWSPLFYPLENITNMFKQWCDRVELYFENDSFENGDNIPTNRISGSIALKEGKTLSSIPHTVRLTDASDSYILIIIKERSPLCLKCKQEGHIRKFCPKFKCVECGQLHESSGGCLKRTYAQTIGLRKQYMSESHALGVQVPNAPKNISVINDCVGSKKASGDSCISQSDLAAEDSSNFRLVTRRVTRSMIKKNIGSIVYPESEMNKSDSKVSNAFELLNDELETMVSGDFIDVDETDTQSALLLNHESKQSVFNRSFQGKCENVQETIGRDELCKKRDRASDEDGSMYSTPKKSKDRSDNDSMNGVGMEQSEQKANELTLQSVSNSGSRCIIFEPWKPVVKWPIWVTCKYCQRRESVVSQPYQDFRCNCGKHFTPDINYNIIYMR